jgi:hypothetical protein
VLSPAEAVGPGYELLPGFIGGRYSWPGDLDGITLVPEGFTPKGVSGVLSAALSAVQTLAVSSPLTAAGSVSGALTASGSTSLGLTPVAAGSSPLVPA